MRQFGLIGYPLSHSFSKPYFTEKFEKEGLTDCQYENYPLATIGALPALLQSKPLLEGLNVTIPYKKQVLPFLQDVSHLPIQACNCIRRVSGNLIGYNTDTVGFEHSLRQYLRPSHRQALVLGTGGASEAVQYVLEKLGIDFLKVSRTPSGIGEKSYADLNEADLRSCTLIINTTPLGMYPNTDSCPDLPYAFVGREHYLFDLVYNPPLTLFLKKGMAQGARIKNGQDMLHIQAEESWKIWNA